MGGKGGGGGSSSSSTASSGSQASDISSAFIPAAFGSFQNLVNAADVITSQPWSPYTSADFSYAMDPLGDPEGWKKYVADWNTAEKGAYDTAGGLYTQAQPLLDEAAGQTRTILQNAYNQMPYYLNAGGSYINQGAQYLPQAGGMIQQGAQYLPGAVAAMNNALGYLPGAADMLRYGQQFIPGAAQYIQSGANMAPSSEYFTRQGAQDVSRLTGQDIEQYLSPFQSNVIDATMANLNEIQGRQQQDVLGNMALRGALGGDRSAVAQAELTRQQGLAAGQTLSGLHQQNYAQALQTAAGQQAVAAQNRARQLQAGQQYADLLSRLGQLGGQYGQLGGLAGQLGTQYGGLGQIAGQIAGQYGNLGQIAGQLGGQYADLGTRMGNMGSQFAQIGGLGQQSAAQQSAMAAQLASIGNARQQALQNQIATQSAMGQKYRDFQQNILNAIYQQYLRKQAYPYQQLQFRAGIQLPGAGAMGGIQNQVGDTMWQSLSNTVSKQSSPNPMGGMMGGAMSLLGGKGRGGRVGFASGGRLSPYDGGGSVPGEDDPNPFSISYIPQMPLSQPKVQFGQIQQVPDMSKQGAGGGKGGKGGGGGGKGGQDLGKMMSQMGKAMKGFGKQSAATSQAGSAIEKGGIDQARPDPYDREPQATPTGEPETAASDEMSSSNFPGSGDNPFTPGEDLAQFDADNVSDAMPSGADDFAMDTGTDFGSMFDEGDGGGDLGDIGDMGAEDFGGEGSYDDFGGEDFGGEDFVGGEDFGDFGGGDFGGGDFGGGDFGGGFDFGGGGLKGNLGGRVLRAFGGRTLAPGFYDDGGEIDLRSLGGSVLMPGFYDDGGEVDFEEPEFEAPEPIEAEAPDIEEPEVPEPEAPEPEEDEAQPSPMMAGDEEDEPSPMSAVSRSLPEPMEMMKGPGAGLPEPQGEDLTQVGRLSTPVDKDAEGDDFNGPVGPFGIEEGLALAGHKFGSPFPESPVSDFSPDLFTPPERGPAGPMREWDTPFAPPAMGDTDMPMPGARPPTSALNLPEPPVPMPAPRPAALMAPNGFGQEFGDPGLPPPPDGIGQPAPGTPMPAPRPTREEALRFMGAPAPTQPPGIGQQIEGALRSGLRRIARANMPQYVYEGLVRRGFSPMEAAGGAGNFFGESGYNPDLNERQPIRGRGGYGFPQWTGPRREAYENYAAQQGVHPGDPDTQMDYYAREMRGSERRAGERAAAARSPEEAAQAINRYYERPATTGRYARSSQISAQRRMAEARRVYDAYGPGSGQPQPVFGQPPDSGVQTAGPGAPTPRDNLPGQRPQPRSPSTQDLRGEMPPPSPAMERVMNESRQRFPEQWQVSPGAGGVNRMGPVPSAPNLSGGIPQEIGERVLPEAFGAPGGVGGSAFPDPSAFPGPIPSGSSPIPASYPGDTRDNLPVQAPQDAQPYTGPGRRSDQEIRDAYGPQGQPMRLERIERAGMGQPQQSGADGYQPRYPTLFGRPMTPERQFWLRFGAGMMASRSPHLANQIGEGLQSALGGIDKAQSHDLAAQRLYQAAQRTSGGLRGTSPRASPGYELEEDPTRPGRPRQVRIPKYDEKGNPIPEKGITGTTSGKSKYFEAEDDTGAKIKGGIIERDGKFYNRFGDEYDPKTKKIIPKDAPQGPQTAPTTQPAPTTTAPQKNLLERALDKASEVTGIPRAKSWTEVDKPRDKSEATDHARAIAEARAAIAKGASREAVIQRLEEQGIDSSGL